MKKIFSTLAAVALLVAGATIPAAAQVPPIQPPPGGTALNTAAGLSLGGALAGASSYGATALSVYGNASVWNQDLYGWGCSAAGLAVVVSSSGLFPWQGYCQVDGDNMNAWGPAAHPTAGEDRVGLITASTASPNTFGGALAGTFTATAFLPTTTLTPTQVAALRVGMEAKTNDATPYWGLISSWAANGTSVTVQAWCLQNAGVESCTSGTPSGTTATLSPKNGIWGLNTITTRQSTSEERQSIGNEFDVNNNTGTNDAGTDATSWPFDVGAVIQSIGTNTATAGLVVSGTFVSGITVENSGTYSIKANGLISTAGGLTAGGALNAGANSSITGWLTVGATGSSVESGVLKNVGGTGINTYVKTVSPDTTHDAAFWSYDGTTSALSGLLGASGCGAGVWAVDIGGCVLKVTSGGGLQIGSPTGGDKGAGTLNLGAGAIYDNGTGPTGTGAYVHATSPTLVTPALGTPSAVNLANATGYPLATTSTAGIVKPDGTTITISGGVISATAGGSGCTVSGAAGIVSNNGSSACTTDTNALLSGGALSLGASGTAGSVVLGNATSGTLTLQAVTGALGSVTLSLPAASDQLIARATTDTLTNKTFDTAGTGNVFKINGTQVSAVTGTGSAVLATSPTLVTPTLGAASATTINGIAITASTGTLVPGTGTATFPAGNSGTVAELNLAQSWTAPQRTNTNTPTISTSTFTPVFSSGQNIRIDFPATTCTCTIANPAAIVAGQSGMFELVQGATSASLNPTWGSEYEYAGGTSGIVLSTGLGAVDYIPYYVDSTGSFIVLGGIIKGPAH
ncbi:MAG: beta strand repeat-containing protein [Alphaproteobacteria bacterium]